jgi:hypothetical protein
MKLAASSCPLCPRRDPQHHRSGKAGAVSAVSGDHPIRRLECYRVARNGTMSVSD